MQRMIRRGILVVAALAVFVVPIAVSAAGGFTDVADDNIFKADIQWMADNDITRGCNPPTNDKFCPSDVVTRETMSAFMHRLGVNKVVDAKTAVTADNATNADKLDGSDAADIALIAIAQVDETTFGALVTEPTTLNAVTITVPTDGVLIIAGGAFINAHQDGLFAFEVYVGSTEIGDFTAFDVFTTAGNSDKEDHLSYTTTAAVTAGTYVVRQRAGLLSGTGSLISGSFFYNSNSMTVTFIPGGTVSASTAGAASGGSIDGN